MDSRSVRFSRTVLPLALALACGAVPASAQLVRQRVAAPDAPKLLVVPFYRDNEDSTLSLLIADGARDRLRTIHLDKFNTIPRNIMNENLSQSGFLVDIPLEPAVVRQLARFLNVRYTIEASLLRRAGDTLFIVGRLVEAQSNQPQSATATVTVARTRANSSTGAELANRLVEGFRVFDEVTQCRTALEQQNYPRAMDRANAAIRQFPNASSAYGCIASVLEAQNAPADSVIAVLRRGLDADSLSTIIMRRLAAKYESRGDTANLVVMLRRVLSIDFRDNDLRIRTARLLVGMGQTDQAVEVVEEGLRQNPASVELLGVKAIALGAAQRWDSAASTMAQVASIDSSKVDSLFVFRITNYYRQVPDTSGWLTWTRTAAEKFPTQRGYVYTLGELLYARSDTAGAVGAGQRYLTTTLADTAFRAVDAATWQRQVNTGHLALGRYQLSAGMVDSALGHAEAVVGDTTLQAFTAPIFLQAGLRAYRDSLWAVAIERLQRAKDFAQGRAVVPAAFFLGLSQVQFGVRLDAEAQAERSCDKSRQLVDLWNAAEQNIIAGAAQNRDAANQLLSQVFPAYKQRADGFTRNFCR
jgi:tetratricopeptide (TPR) repeat protein